MTQKIDLYQPGVLLTEIRSFSLLKKGKKIPKKDCDNPIEQHQIYVNSLGVNSTPSIFLSDGTLILGYETPENVIEKMKN